MTLHNDRATRRRILQVGLAAIGGAAVVRAQAQEKIAQEKVAQSIVQYQDHPKDGQMCSTCVNFEPPGSCKVVAGPIKPNGWCVAYAPKSG